MSKSLLIFGSMALVTVVIAVPVVYLMVRNKGEKKDEVTKEVENNVPLEHRSPFYEAGIILGIGAIPAGFLYLDYGILSHSTLLVRAFEFGLVPGGLLVYGAYVYYNKFKSNRRGLGLSLGLITVGVILVMYSVVGYTNMWLDSGEVSTVKTTAVDKNTLSLNSSKSRSGPVYFYYLTVPIDTGSGNPSYHDIPVHAGEMERAKLNQTSVRLDVHPGAFGVRWVNNVRVGDSRF